MPAVISVNEAIKTLAFTHFPGMPGVAIGADHWMNAAGTPSQQLVARALPVLKTKYRTAVSYALETMTFANLKAEKTDILVFSAHGPEIGPEWMNAVEFLRLLRQRGFIGCREVHFYSCDLGAGIDTFVQNLADHIAAELGRTVPVYAPAGPLDPVLRNNERDYVGFTVRGSPPGKSWSRFEPAKGCQASSGLGTLPEPGP